MLHAVQTNQGAGSPQSSLAVNCNCTRLLLSCRKELWNNLIGRRCTIKEIQVQVLDSLLRELVLLVLGLVQAHD